LGLFDRTLRTPSSTYDYMSYCANSWVSDYGWERNLDAIEVLTGWDFALPSSDERDAIVVGMLGGERPRWFATRGTVPPHGRPVEVSARIGIDTLRLEASVYGLVDGPGEYVVARLPEQPWDQLQVRVEPGPMRVVSADEVGPFPLRAR
jgi:hypothetical protein